MRYFLKLTAVLGLVGCTNPTPVAFVVEGNELEQCIKLHHYYNGINAGWLISVADGPNGVDDNCDGLVDNWSDDDDGDGVTVENGDCDDLEDVYPVSPEEEEVCDGVDNDCNGSIDEGACDGVELSTCAIDRDRDGYGDCDVTIEVGACADIYTDGAFMVDVTGEKFCDEDDRNKNKQ